MIVPFNRGQVSEGIQRFFGLKGGYTPTIDDQLMAMVAVGDVSDSPYLKYAIPVARGVDAPAVAAQISYGVAQPGPVVALQVKQITVVNATAGALSFTVRIMTATDVTGLDTPLAGQLNMLDLHGSPSAGQLRSSTVARGADATQLGNGFDSIRLGADQTAIITYPDPGIFLFGNDEGGRPALAVVCSTVNTAFSAMFKGREWPLPG